MNKYIYILGAIILVVVLTLIFKGSFNTGIIPSPTGTSDPTTVPVSQGILEQLGQPPADSDSDEVKGEFGAKVKSLAQNTNIVNIGKDCVLSPAIISLEHGSNLIFRNQDSIDHAISVMEGLAVAAGKEATIKAEFSGSGTYGITCDGGHIVGFMDLHD